VQQYNENEGAFYFAFVFVVFIAYVETFFYHKSLMLILVKSDVPCIVFFKGKLIVHTKLWYNMGNYLKSFLLKHLLLLIVSP
jgi:hypothetical protein